MEDCWAGLSAEPRTILVLTTRATAPLVGLVLLFCRQLRTLPFHRMNMARPMPFAAFIETLPSAQQQRLLQQDRRLRAQQLLSASLRRALAENAAEIDAGKIPGSADALLHSLTVAIGVGELSMDDAISQLEEHLAAPAPPARQAAKLPPNPPAQLPPRSAAAALQAQHLASTIGITRHSENNRRAFRPFFNKAYTISTTPRF